MNIDLINENNIQVYFFWGMSFFPPCVSFFQPWIFFSTLDVFFSTLFVSLPTVGANLVSPSLREGVALPQGRGGGAAPSPEPPPAVLRPSQRPVRGLFINPPFFHFF